MPKEQFVPEEVMLELSFLQMRRSSPQNKTKSTFEAEGATCTKAQSQTIH